MSPFEKKLNCKDVAPLLVFYVCEEVGESERELIATHLANCHACSEQLAEEKEFHSALSCAPQSSDQFDASGILLSQCRSELAEALDDLSAPPLQEHWRPFGWLHRWMALRPAWSGALLVLVAQPWTPRPALQGPLELCLRLGPRHPATLPANSQLPRARRDSCHVREYPEALGERRRLLPHRAAPPKPSCVRPDSGPCEPH